jgi:SAM-dependent methyltransferase
MMTTCEACSGKVSQFCRAYSTWYYRCNECGLVQLPADVDEAFVHRTYGDEYFYGGGAGYPNYPDESELLREHGRRYARAVSRFAEPGRVLDVGGAAGFIARGFNDFGWTPTIREPNERMSSIASSMGQCISVGTLETFTTREPFDLVTMIQVIEHFYDLQRALEVVASVTAPGGHLLVETWNGASLTARVLRTQWHEFSPPSVRRVFTPRVLDHTLRYYGFSPIATGRPQKWISGSHAKSLLLHKASADNPIMRLASAVARRCVPDRLRLPYPAEDLFWKLYRSEGVPAAHEKVLEVSAASS